jgi:hypothetical protein
MKWQQVSLDVSDRGEVRFEGKCLARPLRTADDSGATPEWISVTLDVNDQGDIKFNNKYLSQRISTNRYCKVSISVHRLVAHAFLGPPPADGGPYVVDHIDGDPSNNAASNLQWLTHGENLRKGGLMSPRPRALTPEQVAEILAVKPAPRETGAEMAGRFGVSVACVKAAMAGRTFSGKGPSNRAKLTPEQVAEIRRNRMPITSSGEVGRRYGVSKTTILKIWKGEWK